MQDLTANEVREFCREMRMTQAQLGAALGISRHAVEKWAQVGAPAYWRYVFSAIRSGLQPWMSETEVAAWENAIRFTWTAFRTQHTLDRVPWGTQNHVSYIDLPIPPEARSYIESQTGRPLDQTPYRFRFVLMYRQDGTWLVTCDGVEVENQMLQAR